jgi:SOS-response transcriptional repressor LexA
MLDMNKYQKMLLGLIYPNGLFETTLSEIGEKIGLNHRQSVKYHLDALVLQGYITFKGDESGIRSILPVNVENDIFLNIPIYGAANCGMATLIAEENLEGYLKVSKKLFNGNERNQENYFSLRAVGDSMNIAQIGDSEGIKNGDYVIIDSSKVPEDNNIVLSIIDGAANIKRFRKETDRITLLSESTEAEKYPPILIHPDDDYYVNGVVIQVVEN